MRQSAAGGEPVTSPSLLPAWVGRSCDPRRLAERLLDRGEPFVLHDERVDLRVLVVQGEGEAGGVGPDGFVLDPGQPDGGGAPLVAALAQVGVHAALAPIARAGVTLLPRPLVHLAEDGLVGGLPLLPVSHGRTPHLPDVPGNRASGARGPA